MMAEWLLLIFKEKKTLKKHTVLPNEVFLFREC